MTAERGRDFVSLQGLRGIAALLVLLLHSTGLAASGQYLDHDPTYGLFRFGKAGVYLFFVLSGFIIFHVHAVDIGRSGALARYAWRRFVRIYPFYWLVLAAAVTIYLREPSLDGGHKGELASLVSSVLLIPLPGSAPVVGVAWTLLHEVLFYAAFGLLLLAPRIGGAVLVGWLLASAASYAIDPDTFAFSGLHTLFALGIAAAWGYRRDIVPAPRLLAALGTAGFVVSAWAQLAGWLPSSETIRALPFGLSSVLVVAGLAVAERRGFSPMPCWLTVLGDASYSVYLTHYFALSGAAKALQRSGLAAIMPTWASWGALVGIALAAGMLCYLAVERRLMRWLRSFAALRPAAADKLGPRPVTPM